MLIIPFTSEEATLSNAGGKGTNLARLTRTRFNVPRGVILSTSAYEAYLNDNKLRSLIVETLLKFPMADSDSLIIASEQIRSAFSAGKMPAEVEKALNKIHSELGKSPLAVRSSATAEDLIELSFAGLQDSFLNIQTKEQLFKAVTDCWSSLWTARAIDYRQKNRIPNDEVSLAVVIQEMVESSVSGVMFTANPLSGLLSETVIEATFGLGETLVSGQIEPDHFAINSITGMINSVSIGSKQYISNGKAGGGVETSPGKDSDHQTLSSKEIIDLASIGQDIQKEFASPQDIEWAKANGNIYILQSRPITSLFPIPEVSFDPLDVWFSFGAVQGLIGPMTPLGLDTIRHLVAYAGGIFGLRINPRELNVLAPAGERIWIKISDVIRNPLGSRIFAVLLDYIEPSVGKILEPLAAENSISQGRGHLKLSTLYAIAVFALPISIQLACIMLRPKKAREIFDNQIESYLKTALVSQAKDRFGRLESAVAYIRDRTTNAFRFLLPKFIPIFGPSMASLNFLSHISGNTSLVLEVTRGLLRNVTTEMDLELWKTAAAIKQNSLQEQTFLAEEPAMLARQYLDNLLPETTQVAISQFMFKYGMRGVGEIDIGQLRWREDPTPVMHILQSYLKANAETAPDVTFEKGAKAALAATNQIAAQVRTQPGGWFKEKLVRAAAQRIRLLMGARESPKFFAIRSMGIARQALLNVGTEFVTAGTLTEPEDIFFLKLDELDQLARNEKSEDFWKPVVAKRRENYRRELRRLQIPRVLVSDGRAFYDGLGAESDTSFVINGTPVSPGTVAGIVHVVLDPRGAQLIQGEILVCPGTDPAWTPLFMIAGGLITEVGGLMTHGSVVAREYGIPAVVGVHLATTRLKTGQKIKIDGSTGEIIVLDQS